MRRTILHWLILFVLASLGGCSSDNRRGPDDPSDGSADDGGPGEDPDGDGGDPSMRDAGEVDPGSLTARIVAPQTVVAGEPVSFDGSGSTDATVFTWNFGDGKRAGAPKAAHIFATAGSYEVSLVVRNAAGARAEAKHTIEVTAGPAAEGESEIAVDVRDSLGSVIAGAKVKTTLGEQTTDEKGRATVRVPRGPATMLWVTHPNFASHARRVQVDKELDEGGYRVVMIKRADPQTVENVEAGAVVEGADGTRLTLPKNALVGPDGKRVTGDVEVSLTPLDTPSTPFAFPSGIEAIDENFERVALASFGVVEVEITQDGKRLDLAEGARATLDIPIYATRSATGEPLSLGGTIPLWSLDEATGIWIQEGQGTIVEGSSRAGFALRSELGHFSWWNCDEPFPTGFLTVKCCADTDGDGECNIATACFLEGLVSCPPQNICDGAESPVTATISAAGTPVLVPVGLPYRLTAYGFLDGMQAASVDNALPPGPVTIVLPYSAPDPTGPDVLPPGYDQTHAFTGEPQSFVFDATGPSWIVVNGPMAGRAKVAPQPQQEFDGTTTASFFVTAGRHTLTVSGSVLGEFRVRTLAGESFIPLSMSPAHGSTTLSGTSPIVIGYNQALNASSIVGINPMTVNMAYLTTNSVSGATLTLTPKADWPLGRQLRVSSALAKTTDGTASPADLSFRLQVASRPGGPWEVYPCPTPYGGCTAVVDYVANETGHALVVFRRRRANGEVGLYAGSYVGGQWRDPVELAYVYASNTDARAALNADGDGMIVWAEKLNPGDSQASFVRRVGVSGGVIGTSSEELVSGASIPTGGALGAAIDELGNEAVMWVSSSQARAVTRSPGGAWSAPRDLFALTTGVPYIAIAGRAGRFVFAVTRGGLRATIYDPTVEEWADGWGPSIEVSGGSSLPRVAINQDGYAYVTAARGTSVAPVVVGFNYEAQTWTEFSALAEGETDTTFDPGCTAAGVVMPDTGYTGYLQACSRKSGEAASANRVWIKPLEGPSIKPPIYTAPASAMYEVHREGYRLFRSADGTLHSFRWDETAKQLLYRSSANNFAGPDRVVYETASGGLPTTLRAALRAGQEPSGAFILYNSGAVAISAP